MPIYYCWTKHGERGVMMEDNEEEEEEDDDSYPMFPEYNEAEGNEDNEAEDQEAPNEHAVDDLGRAIADARRECETEKERLAFDQMIKDHNKLLYPTCEDGHKKLGNTLELLQWKAENGVTDSGFGKLLTIIKRKLPRGNEFPASTYEAKKVVCPLGLDVQKIHACINDCILYRGEYENLDACPVCTALRYKIRRDDPGDVEGERPRKRVPAKVMWYAPIIPRLKRLFRNKEHARLLRWHKEDRKKDEMLRHPADGSQWRKIEFPYFAEDARNLRHTHPIRKKGKHYNGEADHRKKPPHRDGADIFGMVKDLEVIFGKGPGGRSVPNDAAGHAAMWKKKSIFWDLPYWKVLEVRSSIDVMHVTKNLCVNLLGFLGVYGKTKDTPEAREDQQRRKDPKKLHEKDKVRHYSSYALTKAEKEIFFECVRSIKVSSRFSSNIKGIINMEKKTFQNLKSHHCHVIMTELLPIALRGLLPKNVRLPIVKLCAFLNAISQKVINPEILPRLQNDVVQCLVSFELVFPPSFFNIMTHLLVHLVEEISILGPVFLHNMFLFERFMGVLKKYVHNRARPEGSISKGYGTEEVIELCVDFIPDLKPIGVPESRHEGRLSGKGTLGRKSMICRDGISFTQAHYTVLQSSTLVAPYISVHKNFDPLYPEGHPKRIEQDSQRIEPSAPSKKKKKKHKNVVESSEPVNDPNSISISDAETESGNEHDNGNDNDKNDASDKEEVEDEPEKHAKNEKYTKEDFIAKKHGLLDDFFTLVNRAGLATYVGDEREQYYMLTKIFVESFKFHNKQYGPTVAFKIYGNPITMELEEFCVALGITPVGTSRKIEDNPRVLLELYRGITNDDCRTIQRGKIRNIQLPAIKYFSYYIATSILGRENTSNISSYHLAFLIAALTGETPYHLGSLIARRLSSRGPIFGGIIALRILTHLRLPLDSNDVPLTPRRLDITAMKSHHFVTVDSTLDNIVYRMLFADGDEKEIPLPQPGLFSIDRQPWSRTKEEVEEHMKIQDFHQQHDSEDAEPSYDYTVTYPGASSSTYPDYDPSSSYYGGATSWAPWD
ncbi:hypothetical protein QYE76_038711 [Lolium multiflorum]|uniref:Uncharacterized protein n=1 Tax=Lolium multiflorum TaxID=4521 RepID=A0AAD8T9G9_LOLMU|nr:hypothetical protein QYE76_038711 [Lolium multiflorum]